MLQRESYESLPFVFAFPFPAGTSSQYLVCAVSEPFVGWLCISISVCCVSATINVP